MNKTPAEYLTSVLQPLYDDLKVLDQPSDAVTWSYPTLFDLCIDQFEDEGAGNSTLAGGWMFLRSDVTTNNDRIISSFQKVIIANGGCHVWNTGLRIPKSQWNDTGTHLAFRNASDFEIPHLLLAYKVPSEVKQKTQRLSIDAIDAGYLGAGPGVAGYVNENDSLEPDWQIPFLSKRGV